MEAQAQAIEDHLIDSLQFNLKPGASYVTARRSVTFFPQGGNDYKPNGVRVIKINLTGDQWLDPSTVKLFFTVKNNSETQALRAKVPGGHVFFRRCRVLIGGQIAEDIDNYNRTHQMFHVLTPGERRINDFVEGFGMDSEAVQTLDHNELTKPKSIPANGQITIGFTPLVGLFRQNKYLPIRYSPIQIELEVVNRAVDALFGGSLVVGDTDKSEDFSLQDVQLKCDLVDLDDTLDNEYTQFLLDGSILPIHFTALTTGSQIITNYKTDLHISRSLTSLQAVFVT